MQHNFDGSETCTLNTGALLRARGSSRKIYVEMETERKLCDAIINPKG